MGSNQQEREERTNQGHALLIAALLSAPPKAIWVGLILLAGLSLKQAKQNPLGEPRGF